MTEQYPEPTEDDVPDGTQIPTADDMPDEEGDAGVGDVAWHRMPQERWSDHIHSVAV